MAESGLNSRFTDMYKAFQYVDSIVTSTSRRSHGRLTSGTS